jgi:hypothetical protein
MLVAAACVSPALRVVPRPVPPEVSAALLERLRREGAERTSVRGLASVRLESPSGRGRLREVILAERPDRLRLESLNFFGQSDTVLVADSDRYAFYDGRVVERGDGLRGVLRERFGLDLTPEEAVEALLAAPELDPDPDLRVVAYGEEHRVSVAQRRLSMKPDGELVALEALDPDGRTRWVARYGRWREIEGGRYPFLVHLEFPNTRASAEVSLREVELNPPLDRGMFALPEGPSE